MKNSLIWLCCAIISLIAAGCENGHFSDTKNAILESRSSTILSYEEANAMIENLQKENALIDIDFGKQTVPNLNLPTEEMVKVRIALYRIYAHTSIINNRYVITATADELNLSPTTYDFLKTNIHDYSNTDIERRLAEGMNIEDIMSYKPKFESSEEYNHLLHY